MSMGRNGGSLEPGFEPRPATLRGDDKKETMARFFLQYLLFSASSAWRFRSLLRFNLLSTGERELGLRD